MDRRRALVDSAKGALYFLVVGPPTGALVLCVGGAAMMIIESPADFLQLAGVALGFAILAIPFSWVLGAIPAVLTGLVLGPFRSWFHQWRWCLAAGLVGAAMSMLSLWAWPGGGRGEGLASVTGLVFPGFFAAVLVARLFALRAPRHPPLLPRPLSR